MPGHAHDAVEAVFPAPGLVRPLQRAVAHARLIRRLSPVRVRASLCVCVTVQLFLEQECACMYVCMNVCAFVNFSTNADIHNPTHTHARACGIFSSKTREIYSNSHKRRTRFGRER